jgi:hypothetical protein
LFLRKCGEINRVVFTGCGFDSEFTDISHRIGGRDETNILTGELRLIRFKALLDWRLLLVIDIRI